MDVSYFIGWFHNYQPGFEKWCDSTRFSHNFGAHWHYWNGVDMNAGVVDAKKFDTYDEAETALAEILLLHPDRFGQMTIEVWTGSTYRERVDQ